MFTREEIEAFEDKNLATYAMRSKDSKGRQYPELEHKYRSVYQRDRDRIVHCEAFRKLEYKTQVFIIFEGDYYRTRLTHTLEVAQIARTIGRNLRLNEDLIETIALAHDLGHTPFGHAGEEALKELMKDHGGFNHNLQGYRVVTLLEKRYPNFMGLNLSWEVRQGILKHSTEFDIPGENPEFENQGLPTLEAQVVDIADEIAYDNHDLDDGLTANLIGVEDLKEISLWRSIKANIKENSNQMSMDMLKYQIIKALINAQVIDLLTETDKRLKNIGSTSSERARYNKEKLISFSDKMQNERKEIRDFLSNNLYNHFRVIRMTSKAKRFIEDLFNVYLNNPRQLLPYEQKRIVNEDEHRVICDYIAGMTDRFALDEHKKLFNPYEKV
ncbi:MAG: deoxyguanosinetriphosphate triphosphohydrolase [Candidatus Omnitrophota bacterium]|nr:deoxyguanosinetriphosphate triphosphohydrolase [Candidatus Omnitrophota bacterium]